MADLPEVPRRLVTTEAPKSSVSARTLAAPYRAFFEAFGDVGEVIETAGLPTQMEAGAKSVETMPDGQVKVAFRPFELSRSDAAYNRGAQAAYLSTLRPAVAADMAKAAVTYAADPQGFQTHAQNYEQGMLKDKGGQQYMLVQQTVRDEAAQAFRGLTSANLERAEKVNADKITAGMQFRANRISSIVHQDGLEAPEAQQLLAEYSDLAEEQARNPKTAKSPETVQYEVTRFRAGLVIDSARGFVARTYRNDPAAAEAYAAKVMADPSLNLSAEERLKGQSEIVTELQNQTAGRRFEIEELKSREVEPLIGLLSSTANVDPTDITRVRQKAADIGDWPSVRRIDFASQLRDLGSPRAGAAIGGGSVTDRIIAAESGGDPNARPIDPRTGAPRSTALGLGQHIESTWLGLIRKHRPDIAAGKSEAQILALRTDPSLSREMTERLTEDNTGSLVTAGKDPTPGNVYLAHFAGASGAIKVLSAAPGTPVRAILGAEAVEKNPFLVGMTASTLRGWADRKMGAGVGAIDLSRPAIANGDGTISTERTITASFTEDGKEVFYNIPTIVGGKQLGDDDAISLFKAGSNQPVGRFGSRQEAETAARARSEEIGRRRAMPVNPTSLLAQKALYDRAKADLPGAIDDAQTAVERGWGFSQDAGDLLVRQALIANEPKLTRKVETVLLGNAIKQAEGRTTNRMTTAQAQSLILRLRQPGAVGSEAAQLELREMAEKIDARRRKLLDEDPVALGVERQMFPPPAVMDWSAQDGGAAALRQRGQAATIVGDVEGQPNLPALSKTEIEDFEKIYAAAPIEQKAKMLASVATSLEGGVRTETLTRIAGKPGTSGLAWAGGVYAQSPAVAQSVVRGEEILKVKDGEAFAWGSDATDRAVIDKAMPFFPPSAARARGDLEQAIRARYADLSFTAGDRSQVLNSKRFTQALNDVTGGIVEHRGTKIITPQYGLKQPGFDGLLWSLRRSDALRGAYYNDGSPVTASDVMKKLTLAPAGAGRFYLQTGDGKFVGRGSVWDDAGTVVFSDEKPFVLDLRPGLSAQSDRSAAAADRREYGSSLRTLQEQTIRGLQERRR